ncbi:MAG: J domain-containing protein [Candidatus Aminicenantales bacterium]
MKIKNVLEMDYYELLNVPRTASPQEIERAYHLCKSTYQPDSIAHYSLISEEERQAILERIEKAYETLIDAKKRHAYDMEMFEKAPEPRKKAFFRKTTERIVIEDTGEKPGFWKRLRHRLFSPKRR